MTSTTPTSGSGAAPAIALRDALAKGREEIAALHRNGALGEQVASALTDLVDRLVERAFRDALERVAPVLRPAILEQISLVAVGGYGRGDLAPHSDVDLLFLLAPRPAPAARDFVSALVRDVWDAGFKLGHSVRTPRECVAQARQDVTAWTSAVETRLLAGSPALYAEFQRRVHRFLARAPLNRFLRAALAERAKEYQDYYTPTVYLLEPNVKKSPGGLRDVNLVGWVALARYGTRNPELLRAGGVMTAEDAARFGAASEFLHRVRNELHLHAGAPQDVLLREEQVRLAGVLGFESKGGQLGVERFMQQYYRHTTALHDLAQRFCDGARRRSGVRAVVNRLLTDRVEGVFLLNRGQIALDPQAENGMPSAPTLLRLFDLARQHGVAVAHETLERIRVHVSECEVTPRSRERFLGLLAQPSGLGGLLRGLHRVGLLSRILPPFEHVRCLIQFNLYHHYTVDEHSLRVVEAATRRLEDPGPIGQAYREIGRKDLLHLALLLHDLGKGLGEDHSEIGRRIAEEVAPQFGLSEHERQLVVFLVHKHLLMAHTAFRRDVTDEKTLVQFARRVATPEALRMLFVLTAADTEAVAPGSWTGWKETVLNDLYVRASEALTGTAPAAQAPARAEAARLRLQEKLGAEFAADWMSAQLAAMPIGYLLSEEPERVAAHLRVLREFPDAGVRVDSDYTRKTAITRYTVFTRDDLTPGIFSKISGVLAAQGFQILGAQIVTRADGIVIDTFVGVDADYAGEPPAHRREEVAGLIEDVLLGRSTVENLFARRGTVGRRPPAHRAGPVQVEIDNDSSDRHTIIEVFADDRQGLLYAITRTLFELGLSVASARISTRLDQVADVFYVTLQDGRKLTKDEHVQEVRRKLRETLERFQKATQSLP